MTNARGPVWFEIQVQGHLDERWASWFDGLTVEPEPDGTTRLHGPVADQAALHGLLSRLSDLGIPLVSVSSAPVRGHPVPDDPTPDGTTTQKGDTP